MTMAIDTSGEWWKGIDFSDLAEYIRIYTEDGYPAEKIIQCKCQCGAGVFRLEADPDEGCAKRICAACGSEAFVCDSEEYWDDAEPIRCVCPCGGELFELGVGFSFREDGDVKWITVGERCVSCGALGSFVDWKIDYGPTEHLFECTLTKIDTRNNEVSHGVRPAGTRRSEGFAHLHGNGDVRPYRRRGRIERDPAACL
jgi:hypothetical protein